MANSIYGAFKKSLLMDARTLWDETWDEAIRGGLAILSLRLQSGRLLIAESVAMIDSASFGGDFEPTRPDTAIGWVLSDDRGRLILSSDKVSWSFEPGRFYRQFFVPRPVTIPLTKSAKAKGITLTRRIAASGEVAFDGTTITRRIETSPSYDAASGEVTFDGEVTLSSVSPATEVVQLTYGGIPIMSIDLSEYGITPNGGDIMIASPTIQRS